MTSRTDRLLHTIGATVLVGAIFFFVPLFGTIGGYAVGWIVGLFFSETMLGILAQLGIHGVSLPQWGGFLGFCGGFLRTTVNSKESPNA